MDKPQGKEYIFSNIHVVFFVLEGAIAYEVIFKIIQKNFLNAASHYCFNPLNAELNPICHLLALLGAHHILHVSGLRVK